MIFRISLKHTKHFCARQANEKYVFFKNSNTVDTIDHIDKFFESFSSLKHKYCVYLPLNSIKQKKAFDKKETEKKNAKIRAKVASKALKEQLKKAKKAKK